MTRFWLGVCSLLIFSTPLQALNYFNVRVDEFKWMKYETEHFDLYYAKSTEKLTPRMAAYLEMAWEEVGERLNYKVPERTPFFFYSNHNEFEQTNIVSIGEGTGGVTEAFKNRFLIFNDGSERWMKHVIYHEFAHVVQFNVLYGGFWKSIRLLKSPFYPLWLMEGMAEYASGDIDHALGDMMVRDAVYHKHLIPLPELQGFGHLKPNQVTLAYKTGEAAMHFLASEYGKDKVGKLLVTMENHFDVSSALEDLLGVDLSRFDYRFREWLDEKYFDLFERAKPATTYGPMLTHSDGIPQTNESPVVSPDGQSLYYFSDQGGPVQLVHQDRATQKENVILSVKWKAIESFQSRGRALSLSSDGRWLAFAAEKKQKDYLFLYDLKKKKLKRVRVPFDQIRSPVFSPVNSDLVVVGMTRGINDLYLIDKKGNVKKRLTDTHQNETNPTFFPDGKSIVFSGEVLTKDGFNPAGADLFKLHLDDFSVERLTNLPGQEMEPEVLPDGSIVFVRDMDESGRVGFNLNLIKDNRVTQLTDLIGGAFSPRYDLKNESLIWVGFNAGEKHLYQSPAPTGSEGDPPLLEERKEVNWPIHRWPNSQDTVQMVLNEARPYRFQMSTDLFLPFFFYSSLDGLVAANIWQFSDLLGNHRIQEQAQYSSGSDFLDVGLFYSYTRFRPQFSVGMRNQRFFRDANEQRQRRELQGVGIMTYPLDRVRAVSLGVGATDREDVFLDGSENDIRFQDRFWLTGFSYDTVTGRYLVPTRGQRLSLLYQQGGDTVGGNQSYKTGAVSFTQYFPLPRESTLASRLFYGRSTGEDAQVFRLGGVDRIRGTSRGSLLTKKQNVVLASGEMRLRLKYLHARTKFLFPDFFFKAAYLILFNDIGYGWDNRTERQEIQFNEATNSAGVGISWPTFILQSFPLNLTVQWAKQTTSSTEIWYVTLGPSF